MLALALFAAQAMPMVTPPSCAAPAALPPELTGWASQRAIAAATVLTEIDTARLIIGSAARATLAPTPRVAYPVQPGHPGTATTRGGLFAFSVTDPGTYRVALGAAAWIDIVAEGRTVSSTTHAHGPDCSGIRKLVDFPFKPGRYVLQVSGATEPAMTLMVTRLPG